MKKLILIFLLLIPVLSFSRQSQIIIYQEDYIKILQDSSLQKDITVTLNNTDSLLVVEIVDNNYQEKVETQHANFIINILFIIFIVVLIIIFIFVTFKYNYEL